MNRIFSIYRILLKRYGKQGWWPLISHKGCNPTKTGCISGYHPGDYSFPKTDSEIFEICIGAILTQNTGWPNVEKALINLKKRRALEPEHLKRLSDGKLRELIKPAGYYNQKSKKIKLFTAFFISLNGRTPLREELLGIWGIGPETADSILLYAYKVPTFVIDAYTQRFFLKLGLIDRKMDSDDIKQVFETNLEKDLIVFQEYHALIVEHAKRYYSKKPHGKNDFLLDI